MHFAISLKVERIGIHKKDRIIKLIKSHFENWSSEAEISCEIDPRFLNQEQTDVLVSHGFNRVSFGVQDFNEKVQKTIHRIQPFDLTNNAVKMVRAAGIKSVNMDLIYGLPFQTLETFKKTLEIDPDNENAKTNLKQISIFQKKINTYFLFHIGTKIFFLETISNC